MRVSDEGLGVWVRGRGGGTAPPIPPSSHTPIPSPWRSAAVALLLLVALSACAPRPVAPPAATRVDEGAEAFLDTLQARTFAFFWETANPANGLVPDRWPTPSFSSVAAVGFGLTALGVGVEHGYVGRDAAAERALATRRFVWQAPQHAEADGATGHRGFFYHFLDMETGARFETVELSTIDTALLVAGALFAREYFDGTDPDETAIRAYADSLYQRVEWDWAQPRAPLLSHGWTPEAGPIPYDYGGYNEAMLLYLLALGSPTFPADPAAWRAYTAGYTWAEFYGYGFLQFAPLFGHQYSHTWVDFRDVQDEYMRERESDYFENSRRATLSQRAYAAANPMGWADYSADVWGLTACDGPADTTLTVHGEARAFHTYWARGASAVYVNDDGTLAPTAAGGSVPFAPEVAVPALRAMRARYGDALFGRYGFLDSFNPSFTFADRDLPHGRVVPGKGWFDGDYLGIDQGPILLMAENYRSGLVWETMKRSPYLVRGLRRAGFSGGWLDGRPEPEVEVVIRARQAETLEPVLDN